LARQYPTPFYVFSEPEIIRNIHEIQQAFAAHKNTKTFFASKTSKTSRSSSASTPKRTTASTKSRHTTHRRNRTAPTSIAALD
ncbi:hypothetical protein MJH54_35025, partial [Salmonella enterica subsp. enterica serovar Montevideo]|nr:hypothetical protein [Salmonella enterica subsp. enterica serovar Montevideo]